MSFRVYVYPVVKIIKKSIFANEDYTTVDTVGILQLSAWINDIAIK